MFGGIDNDQDWNSDILYSDDEGMHWYAPNATANKLPEEYQSRQNQSVIVNQKSIYIIGGQSNNNSFGDVYRGRLNSLQ
jgi:Neuraminidase (sialidase)